MEIKREDVDPVHLDHWRALVYMEIGLRVP